MAMLIANVTFGPFSPYGAADILVGANLGVAQRLGCLARVMNVIYGYKIVAWDDDAAPELAKLAGIEFGTLKMCKDAVRDALGVR